MIAGSNPFVAPTSFETLRRVQASEYPPLELLRPDAPRACSSRSSAACSRGSPADRFPDAGKLHEQLLGFFYATGERFGSNKLAEFLERFHEDRAAPEIEGAAVFDEQNVANERTPVEVPNPNQQSSGLKPTAAGLYPPHRRAPDGAADHPHRRDRRAARGDGAGALVLRRGPRPAPARRRSAADRPALTARARRCSRATAPSSSRRSPRRWSRSSASATPMAATPRPPCAPRW